ncbi:hypothetical protein KJ840_01490, partial [Patescibacteria group bacterium]|nr:hypothetical protein [Patescibacteria group bacterium]
IGKDLWEVLSNPIALNAYAYTGNNPLIYTDPDGEFRINVFGFLSQRTQVSIGNWGSRLYNSYSVAKYAMDHPVQTGIVAGVAGGALVAGTAAIAGVGVACGALCGSTVAEIGTAGGTAATQGDKINKAFNEVTKLFNNSLAKPGVVDKKLSNIVESLYRAGSKIGNGGTADAIRYELKTGELVSGKSHIIKGQQSINALNNWIRNNINSKEINIARQLINDIKDALNTK